MKLYDLIISRRSIREFQNKEVPMKSLEKFVDAGRLAPQAGNRQPLEFVIIDDDSICEQVFSQIRLAGHIDWRPYIDKQPRAYIVVVVNKHIQKPAWVFFDVACASENICLAAWEDGIGSCLVGAFNKGKLTELLNIPDDHEVSLLVALGFPAHKSCTEDMQDNRIEYRRDEDGTFHVPKRPLNKITHYNKFGKFADE